MAKAKKKAEAKRAQPAPKAETLKPKARVRRRGNTRIITRPGQPGSPGVRENQRDPFLTADDTWDIGEEQRGWADEVSGLQGDLDTRLANLPQTLDEIRRAAGHSRESQSENATDRGIFQSSLNEMALTDINVAETVSTEAAKSLVANAQATLENVRHDIETVRKPALYVRAGNKAVENASAWNASQEYAVDPTPATPGSRVVDYDAKTPGIQNKQQANRNAAQRARQQPTKPGAGRNTQRPQPNRPGAPKKARVQNPRQPLRRETLRQGR